MIKEIEGYLKTVTVMGVMAMIVLVIVKLVTGFASSFKAIMEVCLNENDNR